MSDSIYRIARKHKGGPLAGEKIAEIRKLRETGLSYGKISRAVGVTQTTVQNVILREGAYTDR